MLNKCRPWISRSCPLTAVLCVYVQRRRCKRQSLIWLAILQCPLYVAWSGSSTHLFPSFIAPAPSSGLQREYCVQCPPEPPPRSPRSLAVDPPRLATFEGWHSCYSLCYNNSSTHLFLEVCFSWLQLPPQISSESAMFNVHQSLHQGLPGHWL